MFTYDEVMQTAAKRKYKNFADVPIDIAAEYAAYDAI